MLYVCVHMGACSRVCRSMCACFVCTFAYVCVLHACTHTCLCVIAGVRVCVPIQQVFTQPPGHRPGQISVDTQATTAYLDDPWPLSSWLQKVKPETLAPGEDRCRLQGLPLREVV